jgi:hypothetical protein
VGIASHKASTATKMTAIQILSPSNPLLRHGFDLLRIGHSVFQADVDVVDPKLDVFDELRDESLDEARIGDRKRVVRFVRRLAQKAEMCHEWESN